jgi:hypothetical protein
MANKDASRILFHGTTLQYLDGVLADKKLYVPRPNELLLVTQDFVQSIWHAYDQGSQFSQIPAILVMDKNRIKPAKPRRVTDNGCTYFACKFLKPEWFKAYECPITGSLNRGRNVVDREFLEKILDEFRHS